MRRLERLNMRVIVCWCAVALVAGIALERAYGLRMSKMPEESQSKFAVPRERAIYLKLPILQPVFHWTFRSKRDFLSGKLTLQITGAGRSTTITIFENGRISEGWEAIGQEFPKGGEIYFGFQSSVKYATASGDRLKIELHAKKDLEGIGAMQAGILPAGIYTAEGAYSGLIDEYEVPPNFPKDLPEETIAKLRENAEFRAFLENWEAQWPLQITGDTGWLSPDQRIGMERMLERLKEEDAIE